MNGTTRPTSVSLCNLVNRAMPYVVIFLACTALTSGCALAPSKANSDLRKKNQELVLQVASLERQLKSASALVNPDSSKTAFQLPPYTMERLFLTSKVTITRLSTGDDLDLSRPGDEGFKFTFAPEDQFGHEFKTAGSLRVELFDLAASNPRLGVWDLPTIDLRNLWISSPVLDGYVVSLVWKAVPARTSLLIKITFTEELTGRMFEDQRSIVVTPPTTLPVALPTR